MSSISDLSWKGSVVSWKLDGKEREIRLEHEVAHALALRSGGFAVVAEGNSDAQALLLDEDGSVKSALVNPFPPERGIRFYYFNYERDDLVVVLAGTAGDYKCVVNESTGELSSPRETR